jgi:peptidoglycan/xylan/chitin deacetylase (PgdA/CDA1 family)
MFPVASRSSSRGTPPSMRTAPAANVPAAIRYPVKAALTRGRSTVWMLRSTARDREPGIRILLYHRVADDADELAVAPARFRQQMEALARDGYRVLGVPAAYDAVVRGDLTQPTVGLSFDDAFRDVAENAVPTLERLGFSATVFVTTGVADGRARFGWYGARRQPPVLGWDEVNGLDAEGVVGFEAHTVTHPDLRALDERTARDEIEGSKSELETKLGRAVTAFAYPTGLFTERERALVREAGFAVAVSCEPGLNLADTDAYALRRRQIDARDSLLDFRSKVAGGHDTPLPLRGAYRRVRYGIGVGSPRCAS